MPGAPFGAGRVIEPFTVGDLALRTLRRSDDSVVAAIFLQTQFLGRPLPFELDGAMPFASLAVGWYLEHGRADSVVAVDVDGVPVGYGLVCVDPVGHGRWLRRQAAATTLRLLASTAVGKVGPQSRAFYRSRLRDAVHLARHGARIEGFGHAHVNVLAAHRSGSAARVIRDHVDQRCRAAGLGGWFGEINALPGQRRGALARVAGELIDSSPNYTLTSLTGVPVQRLTVVRSVPPVLAEPASAAYAAS